MEAAAEVSETKLGNLAAANPPSVQFPTVGLGTGRNGLASLSCV